MSTPQIVECQGSCTITVIHEIALPPLNLSVEEGAEIAGAILAIWTIAWAFRVLIQLLKNSDSETTS